MKETTVCPCCGKYPVTKECKPATIEITIRDYFAVRENSLSLPESVAVALMGRPLPDHNIDLIGSMMWWAEAEAAWKYFRADAMIAERAKGVGAR